MVVPVLLLTSPLSAQQPIVIEGATVIDGRGGVLASASVVIEDGRIAGVGAVGEVAVPPGARVINGSDRWVIPGIVETHTHASSDYWRRLALALGVTTAHTLPAAGDTLPWLEPEGTDGVPTPRMIQNPWMFSGLFPDNIAAGTWHVEKPQNPDEATALVEHVHALGFHQIKVLDDDGSMWFEDGEPTPLLPPVVLAGLIGRAHELGMRVYGHAWTAEGYERLVEAGVDAVIHGAADTVLAPELWERMREHGMTWTTTFTVIDRVAEWPEYARRLVADPRLMAVMRPEGRETARRIAAEPVDARPTSMPRFRAMRDSYRDVLRRNTLLARRHGVTIAVGSDSNMGTGTHMEMEHLVEAGLTPAEVITAATFGGAKTLGLASEIGSVEVGKIADLVILDANPLEDIRNARDVYATILGGRVLLQEELLPAAADAGTPR